MARKLSFYDHHRQNYHDAVWRPDHGAHVGEFGICDYDPNRDLRERGEMSLHLFEFNHDKYDGRPHLLSVQVRCFDDGYGCLRALDRAGVLRRIERTDLPNRDALTALLLDCGLRDTSDSPMSS